MFCSKFTRLQCVLFYTRSGIFKSTSASLWTNQISSHVGLSLLSSSSTFSAVSTHKLLGNAWIAFTKIPRQLRIYSSRHFSTDTALNLEVSKENEQFLNVSLKSGQNLVIPALWLRDHCRSPKYYNHETQQKNVDPDLLNRNIAIHSVDLTSDNSVVKITWNDYHVSEFPVNWLISNYFQTEPRPGTERKLWDKATFESHPLPVVSYNDHMTSQSGLVKTVENLCKYGFAIVEGSEATEEATQGVVERVTFVQETLFGKMWTFTSDALRSDTAYSNQALGPHIDLTYMNTPAGIQVFHCVKHTGQGGETLLVDGFRSMNILREEHPEDFELLSKTVVPHEYKEEPSSASPGYHLYSLATVIKTHPSSGELLQLRFNPYDRAPLNTVAPSEIPVFYRAYDRLCRIIGDLNGQFHIKLRPGQVLFIDNWRVMHGRAAFTGTRVMCGCYMPRDEWVSKAKILGVW